MPLGFLATYDCFSLFFEHMFVALQKIIVLFAKFLPEKNGWLAPLGLNFFEIHLSSLSLSKKINACLHFFEAHLLDMNLTHDR